MCACCGDELSDRFPDLTFFFSPPDIVTQVLNFGLPAPIDVQLVGPRGNMQKNYEIARQICKRIQEIPGAVDAHLQQVPLTPELQITADRTLLSQFKLTQQDVANDLLVSLSSSGQVGARIFGSIGKRACNIRFRCRRRSTKSIRSEALESTPVTSPGNPNPQLLANVAKCMHRLGPTNVTHYNVAVSFDVLAGVQGTDLGRVAARFKSCSMKCGPRCRAARPSSSAAKCKR